MGIALMTDIPDQAIIRRVEYVMQRHGQFDNAQPRTQMPARLGHRANGRCTQLIGQLPQLRWLQMAQIRRQGNCVQ